MASTKPFGTVPDNAISRPEPFELHVDEQKLQDMRTLLRLSPVAKETYENRSREMGFGVSREWLLQTKEYWLEGFDWRKQEAHINSFPNFKQKVQDDGGRTFEIHFAALFSERKDAVPLVFLHGWPGSFLEFLPIMSIIRSSYSPEDLPYHIIAPSSIGYGLSSPPPLDRNWEIADTARILHKLLVSLGLTNYVVQGGDIGSYIARTMAATYPECKAMHLNFMMMISAPSKPATDKYPLSETELRNLERIKQFQITGIGYGLMHATRPATIGHVLSSSPMALLAWIGEKFLEWTDRDLPLDTVLTDISLYWFTESFPTSIYTYREDFAAKDSIAASEEGEEEGGYFHGQKKLYVDKPVGYSYFPQEMIAIPRAWAQTTGRLVTVKVHDGGGHFAALEKPEELWEDVKAFLGEAGLG